MGVETVRAFQRVVLDHYEKSGRFDMPWRNTTDPYRITVSEFMLQQTQVSRVTPKYLDFIELYPSFLHLAEAPLRDVVSAWSGLGYNRRAAYLHRTALSVANDFGGRLPHDPEVLRRFPGIGANTAGSIACFAFNRPVVFIETNIRRAFIYWFFSEPVDFAVLEGLKVAERPIPSCFEHRKPVGTVSDTDILPLVEQSLDREMPRRWYYALMDYGSALVRFVPNPNRSSSHYTRQSKFSGSTREARGAVLKLLSQSSRLTIEALCRLSDIDRSRIEPAVAALRNEGFLVDDGGTVTLKE